MADSKIQKNSYLCHVTEIMTSSASFKWTGKRKKCFHAFGQCFQLSLDKTLQNRENMSKSYFSVFVMLYPELFENIDPMNEGSGYY